MVLVSLLSNLNVSCPSSLVLQSSGAVIGTLPGLGSSVAAFTAYGQERKRSKNKEEWGKGCIEGVAAPESANNAVSGPSMIPLLALGVPGSTIAAILLGVFLIHGINVGPRIFETSRELVYGLFASGLLGILIYFLIGFYGSGFYRAHDCQGTNQDNLSLHFPDLFHLGPMQPVPTFSMFSSWLPQDWLAI